MRREAIHSRPFTLADPPTPLPRQIKKPSLSSPAGPLFFQAPPQLYESTKDNLDKALSELLEDGAELDVTDRGLPFTLSLRVKFV